MKKTREWTPGYYPEEDKESQTGGEGPKPNIAREQTTPDTGRYEDKGYIERDWDCHSCGFPTLDKPKERAKRDLWNLAVRVRRAETIVGTERLIKSREEAPSKRQRKKIDKKIKKRRAKLTEAYDKKTLLTEERQRINKEKRRKTKNQKRKQHNAGESSTSSNTEYDFKVAKKIKKI